MLWWLETCVVGRSTPVPLLELWLGIQVSCYLITVMLLLLKNNVTNIEGTTWTWLEFEPVAPSPGSPAAPSTATAWRSAPSSRTTGWSLTGLWNRIETFHPTHPAGLFSIHLWLNVCRVFASLPLIRANWSCLQRDSVSTHRRRHWISDLRVHPTSLRHRDNESNKFETLRRCIQPAWDLVRLSD